MRSLITAGAVVAVTLNGAAALTSQALCAGSSQEIGGNWYCKAVNGIAYQNVGGAGSYKVPTSMNGGACAQTSKSYTGPMAPMDEDVSVNMRGPLKLKKFAVYMPNANKKREPSAAHQRRHQNHQHFHEHNKEVRAAQEEVEAQEKRDAPYITATINGKVVSWPAAGAGGANFAAPTAAPPPSSAAAPAPAKSTSVGAASGGDWTRVGNYDSEKQILDGLVFLNHHGGSGSGVWDGNYGNSLSYASADFTTGAASPQCPKDMTVPSNTEFAIFTDKKCDDSCGFTRPGTVAYKGFEGASKAFFFQFQMPDDGTSGWNMNMPAIWLLNAKIPRTLQYGEATCSCWATGCGEFDLFEVLDSGNKRCKSTFHMNTSGGDSNYFTRPTDAPITAAVIFSGDAQTAHIQILDASSNFNWDTTLSNSLVSSVTATTGNLFSLFSLG